jgi:uncharacterized membrane protein YbhN (UPF0104 family)
MDVERRESSSGRTGLRDRLRRGPLLAGLVVLAAVILVTLRFTELSELAKLAQLAQPAWLIAAVATQALTYACATGVWRLALDRAGYPMPLRELFPLGVAKLFMDQVAPAAGVGGAALVVRALTRRGVKTPAVMTALLVGLTTFYAAYFVFVMGGVALMWARRELPPAAIAAATLFGLFAVGAPTALLLLANGRWERLPRWARRLPGAASAAATMDHVQVDMLKSPRLAAEAVGLQLGILLLDSLTLWICFRAIGAPIDLSVAISAYAMGSVAGSIGFVPLGLGTFEAGAIGALSLHGVSIESALAATLMLRGFTCWLPMLPGLWIARREIGAGPANGEK